MSLPINVSTEESILLQSLATNSLLGELLKNFPEFDQKDIAIGCFGPATAKAVKDAGLRLDLEAPTVEAPSMTAALDKFIAENNKE